MSHRVKHISPILAVADMAETIAFYRDLLGFSVAMEGADYSILQRDGATLHLTLAHDESVLAAVRGHASIYIEVDDIASLWSHVSQFAGRHKTRELFDQDYGMREFHIGDPNDCLVFVGEEIPPE